MGSVRFALARMRRWAAAAQITPLGITVRAAARLPPYRYPAQQVRCLALLVEERGECGCAPLGRLSSRGPVRARGDRRLCCTRPRVPTGDRRKVIHTSPTRIIAEIFVKVVRFVEGCEPTAKRQTGPARLRAGRARGKTPPACAAGPRARLSCARQRARAGRGREICNQLISVTMARVRLQNYTHSHLRSASGPVLLTLHSTAHTRQAAAVCSFR